MMQKLGHSPTTIAPEQLDEIIAAILVGKYSWACFLILRCMGHNPVDYIPYRTYNRLLKENSLVAQSKKQEVYPLTKNTKKATDTQSGLNKIADLEYLEVVREKRNVVRGGDAAPAWSLEGVDGASFVGGFSFLVGALELPDFHN